MSGIFADLTESAIAHPDIFPAKITISFLTSSIPILAMKLKSSSELNPKLISSFTNLLNHSTLSQKQLKVKLRSRTHEPSGPNLSKKFQAGKYKNF